MNNIQYHVDRLRHHGLKRIHAGLEVHAFFCFRPSTTTDAFNLVVFKGVLYLSSPDHGALTFMPFEPDALEWLNDNAHDPEALLEAVPQNALEIVTGQREHEDGSVELVHDDSIDFFLAALVTVNRLLRRDD